MTDTDQAPPGLRNEAAERAVAGGVLHGPDHVDAARAAVGPDDFTSHPLRLVFVTAGDLRDAGEPVDAAAVAIRLTAAGRLADLGPEPLVYLAGLLEAVPTAAGLGYAARQVRDASVRRTLLRIGGELMRDAGDPGEPADEVAARFERELARATGGDGRGGPVPLADALHAAAARYDDAASGSPAVRPIPTGLARLDLFTGGLAPGQLTVLAARPSVGKSALALRFAEGAARAGAGVLLASLEMTEAENTDRLVAAAAHVPLPRLRPGGRIDADDGERIARLFDAGGLAGLPVWVDDRPGQTAAAIATTAGRWARRHGVRVVVVDYLQLIKPDNAKEPRYLQVGAAAKRLKELAKSAGVAVVCLAQLNREVESRGDGRPRLSDLRDSGEVEQDADCVLLLHRLDDDEKMPVHRVDLIVAKCRNGPTGTVALEYHRPFTRFEDRVPLGA